MDLFWLFGNRNKKHQAESSLSESPFDCSSKTRTEDLIEKYKIEEWILKDKANKNSGRLSESDHRELKKIEDEIIRRIPDEFKKNVFRIFGKYKFDIVELLKNNSWEEEIKSVCEEICIFLHYGSPSPLLSNMPLPLPGNEYLLWLLSKAGEDPKDPKSSIFDAAKVMFLEKKIFGCNFSEMELQSIAGRLIVIFAGEYAKQSSAMIDIWLTVPGGKEFLAKIINSFPQKK